MCGKGEAEGKVKEGNEGAAAAGRGGGGGGVDGGGQMDTAVIRK